MARVLAIPVAPAPVKGKRPRRGGDRKYVEGQRLIVEAMRYLAKSNLKQNRAAIELLSEHFRTRFRMEDSPLR